MDHETKEVVRQTHEHIRRVGTILADVSGRLVLRAVHHDTSKFSDEEIGDFVRMTPKLRGLTYGSDEYKAALAELGPALKHHYSCNPHHPEFWPGGVSEMSLLDLLEMLCDWKAATERHADGSIFNSLKHNRVRFGIPNALHNVMVKTSAELGWIAPGQVGDLLMSAEAK